MIPRMDNQPQKQKALFLDRDGVIDKEQGRYVVSLADLEFLPGITDVMKHAKAKGYCIVVVTNQPQIAKGLLTPEGLTEIHDKMQEHCGGMIDRFYHCPHIDADDCLCRKPKPGMLHQAIADFNIDPQNSIMIGDKDKDIFAGKAVGARTIFIENEFKYKYFDESCNPDHVIQNPIEIIGLI